jgi:uncharacterized membrane protein YdbT with pleckstrin-like domain
MAQQWAEDGAVMDWFVRWQIKMEPQERFEEAWRKSSLVLLWRLLGPLLMAILLVVAFLLNMPAASQVERVIVAALLPLSFIVVMWISVVIVQWYVNIYVLTNRRLIHRKGILIRSREESQLPRVQNASYAAEMVQKWLGLGTVKVETASVGPPLVITSVRDPLGISQRILVAAEQAKQELALMDENQVRRLLGARLSQGT